MSNTPSGLPNVSYDFYHTFLASIGLLLVFLSGGAIFAYVVGIYSFVRISSLSGIVLTLLPGIAGAWSLREGMSAWKKRAEKRNEMAKQELRQRSANADIAEKEAEQLEREEDAANTNKVTIGNEEHELKEWEK